MLGCRSSWKGQDTMLFRFTLNTQYSAACLTVTAAFTVSKIFKSWFSSVLFVKPFSPSRFLTGNPVRRGVVPIVGRSFRLRKSWRFISVRTVIRFSRFNEPEGPARHFKCSWEAYMRNTPHFTMDIFSIKVRHLPKKIFLWVKGPPHSQIPAAGLQSV